MFLRATSRRKDGKLHRYWSVVENRRVGGGRTVQKTLLYLGEIGSRDKRGDCVQVVVALVVTPEGFPVAYEVLAGNPSDKTTRGDFLRRIQTRYGKASRIWLMDRGIPSEEVLEQMRQSDPPAYYLVGTPKGRLGRFEAELASRPWQQVREEVEVKLLAQEGELYVQARKAQQLTLAMLKLELPAQTPPKIQAPAPADVGRCGEDFCPG